MQQSTTPHLFYTYCFGNFKISHNANIQCTLHICCVIHYLISLESENKLVKMFYYFLNFIFQPACNKAPHHICSTSGLACKFKRPDDVETDNNCTIRITISQILSNPPHYICSLSKLNIITAQIRSQYLKYNPTNHNTIVF